MNVAFDKWIPVVTTDGSPELASLCEVLTEGTRFADLAVRPHERVALMRLLLCVTHAALDGPKDYEEWRQVPSRLPDAVRRYLQKWEDSFELFHPEKPWLQVADLRPMPSDQSNESSNDEAGYSSINRLSFTRASGNNTTLFDHAAGGVEPEDSLPHDVVLNLLTFQNWFVAGGKASSRMWGKHRMKNPPNPKGGPCAGKSILYTFLRGRTLAETIHLNLNSHDNLILSHSPSSDWLGRPIWEVPIESPKDERAIANATHTYLGRLVPQTRILRLNKDGRTILLGAGFTYPKFQDEANPFQPDSYATIVVGRDGERELLCARSSRAIWRELHSLAVRRRNASASNRGPLCLGNVPDKTPCDIVACALVTNPMKAAEIVDLVDSAFHVPAQLLESDGSQSYEAEVKIADEIANRLGWAIEAYRSAYDAGWEGRLKSAKDKRELRAKLHGIATTHYWTAAEKNLPLLMAHIEAIGTDNSLSTRDMWRKGLFAAACDAYRTTCGQNTPRQIRAFADGWKRFLNEKVETTPVKEEDDEA